jgi:hypothetical protein
MPTNATNLHRTHATHLHSASNLSETQDPSPTKTIILSQLQVAEITLKTTTVRIEEKIVEVKGCSVIQVRTGEKERRGREKEKIGGRGGKDQAVLCDASG